MLFNFTASTGSSLCEVFLELPSMEAPGFTYTPSPQIPTSSHAEIQESGKRLVLHPLFLPWSLFTFPMGSSSPFRFLPLSEEPPLSFVSPSCYVLVFGLESHRMICCCFLFHIFLERAGFHFLTTYQFPMTAPHFSEVLICPQSCISNFQTSLHTFQIFHTYSFPALILSYFNLGNFSKLYTDCVTPPHSLLKILIPSVQFTFSSLGLNTWQPPFKWGAVDFGSQLTPWLAALKQKWHHGRVWEKKAVHVKATRK